MKRELTGEIKTERTKGEKAESKKEASASNKHLWILVQNVCKPGKFSFPPFLQFNYLCLRIKKRIIAYSYQTRSGFDPVKESGPELHGSTWKN